MFPNTPRVPLIIICSIFLFFAGVSENVSAQDSEIIYLEWIDDPTTTIIINWIADSGSNRTVEFRKPGNSWSSINSGINSIPGTSKNRYKASLTGLDEGSVYEFKVGGSSRVYSFRTAPGSIEDPMRFIIAGDIYTDAVGTLKSRTIDAFINMSENASEYDPFFAALGGDLAHAGSNADDVGLWFEFLKMWQDRMITSEGHLIPMVISIGNNEVPGGFGAEPEDLIFINSLFSFPKDQWGNSSFNHYGVLDFGDYLSLFMLNTNHSNQIEGEQTSWLSDQLRSRSDIDHIFPVYHVAGWPVHRTFRGIHEDAVRNNWHKLFYENDLRVVFEHHDHVFKMTRALGGCNVPINNQKDCSFDPLGVIYMGGGSWASPNDREFREDWYVNKVSRDHNFVLVEITNSKRSFTAIGENGEDITSFTDYIEIAPPEQITSMNITTDSFTLGWNKVEGAERYFIDVARDENFQNYVGDYKNRNVGTNTSLSISDLDPNQRYYFRIRSESLFDLGEYSDVLQITLVPETPVALNESDLRVTSFSANWDSVPNVSDYEISVSTDSSFTSFVSGFNQKRVENITTIIVGNLEPDTEYYYSVRAILPPQESELSNVISIKTIGLDKQLSGIEVDLNKVLANSDQLATVTVSLIDENGNPVDDVEINLTQDRGSSTISPVTDNRTNSNGSVTFEITSENPGEVLYKAFLSNSEIGNGVSIEFQPFLDKAQIGNNFPNPFSSYTRIPITIPRQMDVHLSVVSILGKSVQTILNESRSTGYYEIELHPNGLASGVYFIRLVSEDGVSLNKITYTK
jgi:hypothetical protein